MAPKPPRLLKRTPLPAIWLRTICLLLLGLSQVGCNYVIGLGYLIGGPPSIEPDFDQQTGKSLSEKETTVLVLCYAPTETKWDFESVDRELALHVAHRLNQNHIRVVDPDSVLAWLDENTDWDKPDQIGADFGVDYVIYIEIGKFSLYEEHSHHLYRGNSDLMVTVYEMDKDEDEVREHKKDGKKKEKSTAEGSVIYSKEVHSKFPTLEPMSTADQTFYNFKRMYMSRLSEEVGQLFYEQFAGDNFGNAGF